MLDFRAKGTAMVDRREAVMSAAPPAGAGIQSIVTLTMNPALDLSTSTDRVVSEHKLRCGPTHLDPGGGGINVSRLIHLFGGESLAIYTIGGLTGSALRHMLDVEGVSSRAVPITGTTRQSFTVDETATGSQFRFVLQGPELTEPEWHACLTAVRQTMRHGGYIVASGSLPPGVPDDFYARVARLARAHGARFVVDASGDPLREALAEGVYLVKPSRRELSELVGETLDSEQSQVDAAAALVSAGSAELVALTRGAEGAVLASAAGIARVLAPRVHVLGSVGAGDSFLGAMVLRLSHGRDPEEAFRFAVATGTATTMTPGTDLCRPEDAAALEAQLTASVLN
jgi:6-phosphofructokinase 2